MFPLRVACLTAVLQTTVARRLERLRGGPLATPTNGLTVEWSSPDHCWDSTNGQPAWSEAQALIADILGCSDNPHRISIINVHKTTRKGYTPLYVINFRDTAHTTSLVDLADKVRQKINQIYIQEFATRQFVEGYAGTLTHSSWGAYLRDRENTCPTTGDWGHFSVWMTVGQHSAHLFVHMQCWVQMYSSSTSSELCIKKIDMVIPEVPKPNVGSARWDIPVLMTNYNTYYHWSCTFSKVNDGNIFANAGSDITELCTVSYETVNPYNWCNGKGSPDDQTFRGTVQFKTYSEPDTYKPQPS